MPEDIRDLGLFPWRASNRHSEPYITEHCTTHRPFFEHHKCASGIRKYDGARKFFVVLELSRCLVDLLSDLRVRIEDAESRRHRLRLKFLDIEVDGVPFESQAVVGIRGLPLDRLFVGPILISVGIQILFEPVFGLGCLDCPLVTCPYYKVARLQSRTAFCGFLQASFRGRPLSGAAAFFGVTVFVHVPASTLKSL